MHMELIHHNGIDVAAVSSEEAVILDAQTALDLAMTVQYEMGTANLAVDKKAIAEDFFVLSTGMAGEILQKFTNYHIRMAVYGDYARYTSKPLKAFLYETNRGSDFFFVATREEAVKRLTEAP